MAYISIHSAGYSDLNTRLNSYSALIIGSGKSDSYTISGVYRNSTCHRIELIGIIEALRKVISNSSSFDAEVTVFTPSKYVTDCYNKWVNNWAKNNFEGVKNKDLWKILLDCISDLPSTRIVCSGKRDNVYGEMCFEEAKKLAKKPTQVLNDPGIKYEVRQQRFELIKRKDLQPKN